MESAFLLERKIISLFFNPIKETVFLLIVEGQKLDLIEENLINNVIIKRFKILSLNEQNIVLNSNRKIPKGSFEGYSIYFWSQMKKLIMIFPNCYMVIYDYFSGALESHFQTRGKNPYVIRNIIGSHLQNCLFFSAEGMRNIYSLSFESITKGTPSYIKLVIPKLVTVHDIICHPNEKYLFVACSDGITRCFNTLTGKEVIGGLVDIPLGKDNKPQKNQTELIKQSNILNVLSLDINSYGNYILSSNENGYLYLWDCLTAIKGKRNLLTKSKLSVGGVFSCKFLAIKQFENLDRIICLTKEGKIYILSITISETTKNTSTSKSYVFNKLYENSIFNQTHYSFNKYNIITSQFITFSNTSNLISIKWPQTRMDKIKNVDGKNEDYLLLVNYSSKFFFIYDNIHPKINFTNATQMTYCDYKDLIPTDTNKIIVERFIYVCDNYFIYQYDVVQGSIRKLLNYTKEYNLKYALPLKFDAKPKRKRIDNTTDMKFLILIQNDNANKMVLYIQMNGETGNSTVRMSKKFEDVIDFTVLGNEEDDILEFLLLNKNKQIAMIYNVNTNSIENVNIEGSINRVYWSPFTQGYSVIYRNVLNQLKFSENISLSIFHKTTRNEKDHYFEKEIKENNDNFSNIQENEYTNIRPTVVSFNVNEHKQSTNSIKSNSVSKPLFNFKNENKTSLYLDFSEREIDIVWSSPAKNEYWCAISMIEKILICNHELTPLFKVKIALLENPNIISSMYWVGKTLIYTRGNDIYYYYPQDNILNKIFTNDQTHTIVSGITPDRFILSNKIWGSKELVTISVTTPIISPLELILIGYLDYNDMDYNIVKEAVINLFTNQLSDSLINKFLKKDLKEVAYNFIKDNKSSYTHTSQKIKVANDLLDFENSFDLLLPNLDPKNNIQMEDLLWKLEYDQNYNFLKNEILNQYSFLLENGQFLTAVKLLEMISEYPRLINILLFSMKPTDFAKMLHLFNSKQRLNFTESLLINNTFLCSKSEKSNFLDVCEISKFDSMNNPLNADAMKESNKNKNTSSTKYFYSKVFDNYKGEPSLIGTFEQSFESQVINIPNVEKTVNKKNSHIHNIPKKFINFGESLFTQYAEVFNSDIQNYELVPICSLSQQKIEHYYGYFNTQNEQKKQKK